MRELVTNKPKLSSTRAKEIVLRAMTEGCSNAEVVQRLRAAKVLRKSETLSGHTLWAWRNKPEVKEAIGRRKDLAIQSAQVSFCDQIADSNSIARLAARKLLESDGAIVLENPRAAAVFANMFDRAFTATKLISQLPLTVGSAQEDDREARAREIKMAVYDAVEELLDQDGVPPLDGYEADDPATDLRSPEK